MSLTGDCRMTANHLVWHRLRKLGHLQFTTPSIEVLLEAKAWNPFQLQRIVHGIPFVWVAQTPRQPRRIFRHVLMRFVRGADGMLVAFIVSGSA